MIPARIGVWPVLPPRAYLRRAPRPLPFPFDRSPALYARARAGLLHVLRALVPPGGAVLLPAYHHGSEVEAVLAAGLEPRFYGGDARLEPLDEELDALLDDRVRALHLVHYLGFPQDGERWRRWCDARGLLLVEDAAQAWLAERDGRPVGSWGDAAVFCLYKTFGIPDGAAVLGIGAGDTCAPRLGLEALLRRHASRELGRSHLVEEAVRRRRAATGAAPEAEFAVGDADAPPSRLSLALLPRVFDPAAAAKRRRNYALLLDALGDAVAEPFAELPAGASPFAFPFATDDKEGVMAALDRARVTPLDFWSLPHPALPAGRFARERRLRATVVGLPVHQDVTERDLERVVRVVRRRGRRRLRLEPLELDAARGSWSELAEASGNVFGTWEWASTWWRHHGHGRPLVTGAYDGSGRLAAILPLYLWRERPRVLRFLGHGEGDELGPVCAPPDRELAAAALRQGLAERFWPWDVFLGEQLRGDEGWADALGARLVRRTGFPVLPLRERDWDAFLAARSANFRQTLRRRERRLNTAFAVRFRAATAESFAADFETLVRLHDLRWPDRTSTFTAPGRLPFHREFAAVAHDRGWARLWVLELDGEPAAAWYGFRFGGADGFYQSGRDPRFDAYGVGTLLLARTIRDALESGAREYRFLRGDEPYKYRLATDDPGLDVVVRGRGAFDAAAAAATAAFGRPELHEPLRRLAGA